MGRKKQNDAPNIPDEEDLTAEDQQDDAPPELPKKKPGPDDWVAARAGVVGPDQHAYKCGEHIPDFATWPHISRTILIRDGYVCAAREYAGDTTVKIVVPPPVLAAVPMKKREPEEKRDEADPNFVSAEEFAATRVGQFPKFDHNMDLGEDDGIKIEGPRSVRSVRPAHLPPGTRALLDDGSSFEVLDDSMDGMDSTERSDAEEGAPQKCNMCNEHFDGVSSLKIHEATKHAYGQNLYEQPQP